MLSVIMLSVIMLSVIMLSVIMLSVIMLFVVTLSVVGPFANNAWKQLFVRCHRCLINSDVEKMNNI